MNRLRVLKQRAARGLCGVTKHKGQWWVGCGKGMGDHAGPFVSYREAIQLAARWAIPGPTLRVYIDGVRVH